MAVTQTASMQGKQNNFVNTESKKNYIPRRIIFSSLIIYISHILIVFMELTVQQKQI